MTHIKCPACEEGLTTTSRTPNLFNHLKRRAAHELLDQYLLGEGEIKHAEWLKKNVKVVQKTEIIMTAK